MTPALPSGAGAVLCGALYVLALLPGLPLGWRLFGRTNPLGWVGGALLGYAISALTFWVPARLGLPHPLAFLGAWLVVTITLWRVRWKPDALTSLPAWTIADRRYWLGLLLIVLLFVGLPFSRVGEVDTTGARNYRAYFTADFVWHMALTEELRRFEFPLTNPYLAPEKIHYYWTYFMVPAVLAGPEQSPLVTVETALKVCAIGTALLMFSAVFLGVWSVTGRSGAAFAASLLALMAPSWEGLYVLIDFWQRGLDSRAIFEQLRGMNIDAVTNWQFHGLRIDGLVRSMWWTPQHSMSFALGLVALIAAAHSKASSRAAVVAIGLTLACSVAMNPFLGAAFSGMYGIVVLWSIARSQTSPASLLNQWMTVGPVVLAVGWTMLNQMGDGAGAAVSIGWGELARHAPAKTILLSMGGLIVPAALCLWPWRRRDLTTAWVAIPAVAIGLLLALFVSLTDIAWVGFRAGNILQVTLPMLAGCGLAALFDSSRRTAIALFVLLLLCGAPTTLIDTFNAQDLENRTMGPGFRWTIPLSTEQQDGFRWIRRTAPSSAIVQVDPVVRGRDTWSLIPSFAGRRMAAGEPISLLPIPAYEERSAVVHDLLTRMDLPEAHARALAMGINYLWLDDQDDPKIGDRLEAAPSLFAQVFRRGVVRVFEVRTSR